MVLDTHWQFTTVDVSLPKLVLAPTEKKTLAGTCDFEIISEFLQEFLVVNSCHVRTKTLLKDADDYISWKDYLRDCLRESCW